MIGAVIMASGASTRMGKNKLLLEYDGKPLILHTIERILEQDFHDIVIVTCHKEIAEIANLNGIRCIYNNSAKFGQSQSIKLGVENLESLQLLDGYMFFTGDQPLMDGGTINKLIRCFNAHQNNIIVPSFKGRKGNPVIFPKKFRDELLSLTGDTGGRSVLNQNPGDVILVEIENQYAIWDIDTPEDYKKLIDIKKGK